MKGIALSSKEYSASSLQVLEGLDAVRKRPGMYIGSTDERGLHHCVWEIIDNAVDEALAGFCTKITVSLNEDGSITVEDNGRGIPVDIEPKTGLSGVEVVFTKLHAGGKFGGGSYGASGGLHGVGASVVNALSSKIFVQVHKNNYVHYLDFDKGTPGRFNDKGVFKPGSLSKGEKTSKTGTTVTFYPDSSIFLKEATIDWGSLLTRARQTAFLVPGLEIIANDYRDGRNVSEHFLFNGGVKDFVDFLAPDPAVTDTLIIEGSQEFTELVPVLVNDELVSTEVSRECKVEIGLRWGTGYETVLQSFVNIISTPKGGTHVNGFEKALVKSLNESLRSSKVLKSSEPSVLKEDCLEGLTAVVLVRLAEPQFEGQTKEILGTSAVQGVVNSIVSDFLTTFLQNPRNKKLSKLINDKVYSAAKARIAARTHRETIRRKNALESSSLPAKLSDCRSNDFEESELFIIEGDSAGGTVKAARDAEFQALMPIRGKILNTMRASEKQMLDNAECASIIAAMGAGSGKSFDSSQIRYGKLIVLADADVDGAHIRCLLLTLAYRYMRPLLAEGRVYSAVPPLFRVSTSKDHYYCYSDLERDAVVVKLEKAGVKIKEIQRYKGLGEMDADQLAETTLDKSKRKLRRMAMTDGEHAQKTFEMLMGSEVTDRKNFIITNGGLLNPDRIDA